MLLVQLAPNAICCSLLQTPNVLRVGSSWLYLRLDPSALSTINKHTHQLISEMTSPVGRS